MGVLSGRVQVAGLGQAGPAGQLAGSVYISEQTTEPLRGKQKFRNFGRSIECETFEGSATKQLNEMLDNCEML